MTNIINNDPSQTQYVFGTDDYDIFEVGGPSSEYGFGKTQDGKGVVIWNLADTSKFDILYNVEEFQFTDKGYQYKDGEIIECDCNKPDGQNNAPVAQDDQVSGDAGSVLTVNPLANDTDADGDTLTVTQINGVDMQPGWSTWVNGVGLVTLNADNTVSIDPADGVTWGSVPYTVSDGNGGTATANINFDVNGGTPPANTPPVAQDDQVSGDAGSVLTLNPLANDSDADGDTLTITQINGVDMQPGWSTWVNGVGLVTLNADNTVSIDPADGVTWGSVPYTVSDGNGGTATANINFDVNGGTPPANTPPVAQDDQVSGDAGSVLTLNPLANDTDADGDTLTITQINGVDMQPGWSTWVNGVGLVTLNADNTVSIDPADGVTWGSVPYTISDGNGGTSIANINFDVNGGTPPANTPPVANNDSVTGETGETLTLNPLANDTDADGDTLTITQINGQDVQPGDSVTVDGVGVYTLNADGSVSVVPADGVTWGSVPYTISDGNGGTSIANINFDVNQPPVDPATSSIGDQVWLDANGNGIQDAGEKGVANVEVLLKDADGNVIATQQTDENGNYSFDGLEAGRYSIGIEELDGYELTRANLGDDDTIDSDLFPATNNSRFIDLGVNEQNTTVDAGLVQKGIEADGRVWGDPHFRGADGELYEVTGEDGGYYNILSDSGIQVNSLFSEPRDGVTIVRATGVTIGDDTIFYNSLGILSINGEVIKGDGSFLDGTVVREGNVVTLTGDDEYELTLTAAANPNGDHPRMTIDISTDNAVADGVLPDGLWGVTVDGDGIARDGDRGVGAQGGGVIEDINGNITENGDTTTVQTYEVDRLFNTNFEHHNQFHEEGVYISENSIETSDLAQTPNTIDAFVEELMA